MDRTCIVRKFTKNENGELEFSKDKRVFSNYMLASMYISKQRHKPISLPDKRTVCDSYMSELFGEYELRTYYIKDEENHLLII